MPTRLCTHKHCPNPATYRGYCATHATQRNHETHRNRHIYNSKRWNLTRRWHLFHHPHCTNCGDLATQVHHRTDITAGGDPWNPDNLESLCHPCHSRITRQHQHAGSQYAPPQQQAE